MFYDKQPEQQRELYKRILSLVGSLSNLFSVSNEPMLNYRSHENIFCKCFDATNLSREDCSADAAKDNIGVGLKTWVGRNDQKVAEFGRLRPHYADLTGMELIQTIAEYRNTRIRTTMKMHGLKEMLYHVVKRVPNGMEIYEGTFDLIDKENIVIDENRGKENNTYFSDGRHTYHFSSSKNTLYMMFDDMDLMDSFDVTIAEDPYRALIELFPEQAMPVENEERRRLIQKNALENQEEQYPQLCLRLYAVKADGTKYVPEKSGLNQWNADGRKRDPNEVYIAYLAEDRERDSKFFPSKDTSFNLALPDGSVISAKVCQSAYKKMQKEDYQKLTLQEREHEDIRSKTGKSIMSNPNKVLGKWLLRDVFELEENTILTYDMLRKFGVDSVLFTKYSDEDYSVDFCPLGTYEKMYKLDDIEAKYD